MIPDDFTALAAEFNETARKFHSNDLITTNLLLAKYTALLDFKAQTDSDRTEVTRTLLDCSLTLLKKAAAPPTSGTRFTPGEINYPQSAKADAAAIFQRLAAPDSIVALPAKAPEELADAALAVLRKVEDLRYDQFSSSDRTNYGGSLTSLAELALQYAGQFKTAQCDPEISTTRNISPSKRITFKKEGPDASP
jgi:hypothetical protein